MATGGGKQPTFRTARAQPAHSTRCAPFSFNPALRLSRSMIVLDIASFLDCHSGIQHSCLPSLQLTSICVHFPSTLHCAFLDPCLCCALQTDIAGCCHHDNHVRNSFFMWMGFGSHWAIFCATATLLSWFSIIRFLFAANNYFCEQFRHSWWKLLFSLPALSSFDISKNNSQQIKRFCSVV